MIHQTYMIRRGPRASSGLTPVLARWTLVNYCIEQRCCVSELQDVTVELTQAEDGRIEKYNFRPSELIDNVFDEISDDELNACLCETCAGSSLPFDFILRNRRARRALLRNDGIIVFVCFTHSGITVLLESVRDAKSFLQGRIDIGSIIVRKFEQSSPRGPQVVPSSILQLVAPLRQSSNTPSIPIRTRTLRVIAEEEEETMSNKLRGKRFCITGTLSRTRKQITALIEEHGGSFIPDIRSGVTHLIVGLKPGSKLRKAENMGIETIYEHDLMSMIGEDATPSPETQVLRETRGDAKKAVTRKLNMPAKPQITKRRLNMDD